MKYALLGAVTQLSGLALVFAEPSPALKLTGGAVSLLALGWSLRAARRTSVDAGSSVSGARGSAVEAAPAPVTADEPRGEFSHDPSVPPLALTGAVAAGLERDSGVVVREGAEAEDAGDLKLALLRALVEDKSGFYEFYREAKCRVSELSEGTLRGPAASQGLLTLARMSALWGLARVATGAEQALLRLSGTLQEERSSDPGRMDDRAPSTEELVPLSAAFRELEDTLAQANGHEPDEVLEINYGAFDALIEQSRSNPEPSLAQLERLRQEPARHRFRKLRSYAERLATVQGKTRPEVEIRDGELLLTRERFSAVWGALIHLVDNCLEHGFESQEERIALGKSPKGRLSLRSRAEDSKIILEVSDDGRGIDWSVVAERARQSKLRAATRDDLVLALLSGRLLGETRPSLGLSALNAACRELHGNVTVVSSPGRGTTFRISLPLRSNLAMFVPSINPSPDRASSPLAFAHSPVRINEVR